jgi:hypothetical protein
VKLPSYPGDQVAIQQLQVGHVDTSAPPSAFGAGIGQGLSSLGYDVGAVYADAQQSADNTALTSARAAVDTWDTQKVYSEFVQMQGKSAMDRSQPLIKERNDYLGSLRAGLTPQQQAAFDKQMLGRNLTFQRTLYGHTAKAAGDYADATEKSAGEAFVEKIGAMGPAQIPQAMDRDGNLILDTDSTDLVIAQRLAEQDAYIQNNRSRFADPDGALANAHSETLTAAHALIIDAYRKEGDDVAAAQYFEEKKSEMAPAERNKLQADVTRIQQDGMVRRGVGEAWARFVPADAFEPPTPGQEQLSETQILKSAHDWIDKEIVDEDAQRDLAKEAKTQFDANFKAQQGAAEDQRKAWGAEFDAAIKAGAPWSAIASDPNFARLDQDQQDARAKYYNDNAEGTYIVTPPETYDKIHTLMVNDSASFLDLDAHTMAGNREISKQDADWIVAQQKRITDEREKPGGGAPGFLTPSRVVSERINEYFGVSGDYRDAGKWKEVQGRRGQAMWEANGIITQIEQREGRTATAEEAQQVMDQLLANVTLKGADVNWFSANDDLQAPLLDLVGKLDIPTDELVGLASYLRGHGKDVSDENIKALHAKPGWQSLWAGR